MPKDEKPVNEGQDVKDQAPAPSAGESGQEPQDVPYTRFKEVNDAYRAYKETGLEPEDVYALAELALTLQQKSTSSRADAAAAGQPRFGGDGQGLSEADLKLLRDYIFRAEPRFQQVLDTHEKRQKDDAEFLELMAEEAQETLKALAKSVNIPDEVYDDFEAQVVGLVAKNRRLHARYLRGDLSVVDRAFKSWRASAEPLARGFAASVTGKKETNKRELAPKVSGGGAPGPKVPEKPKITSIEDLAPTVQAFLKEHMSEIPGSADEAE